MVKSRLTGQWVRAGKMINTKNFSTSVHIVYRSYLAIAAKKLKAAIELGIRRGRSEWPPLHPFTIERKFHDRPLLDKGKLVKSIRIKWIGAFEVFIGIPSNSPTYVVGWVHEHGVVIRVTDKMRKYLHAIGLHLKNTTQAIVIPKRAFIEPAYRETFKYLEAGAVKAGGEIWKTTMLL